MGTALGEPLATQVPHWWKAFHEHFTIYWPEPEPEPENEFTDSPSSPIGKPEPSKRWRKRKASSLM